MSKKNSDITLRSEEVQEILTKVPHWIIRYGNFVFLGLILLILGLTWLIKYPDIITAEAIITTQEPPQKKYARQIGKIDSVFVTNNGLVTIDEPLILLENTARYSDVKLLKKLLNSFKNERDNLSFPIDSIPPLILGEIDSYFAIFENNVILYKINSELKPYTSQISANKFSIKELKRRLTYLNSQRELQIFKLTYIIKNVDRHKSLFEKGVISELELENKLLDFNQAERDLKSSEISISQIEGVLSESNRDLRGTQIKDNRDQKILHRNVNQSLSQLKKSIQDWEMKYVLKSNIVGRVVFLKFWTKNQFVSEGDLVCTVIPKHNSHFIAKLKTPLLNSGKLQIGQRVNIRLDNYPYAEFGIIKGKVDKISLLTDENGFYQVEVKLPLSLKTTYNEVIEFKQEMRGVAEIITEDLRLIERLLFNIKKVIKQ